MPPEHLNNQPLDPDMPAGYAIALLLWQALETLLANQDTVIRTQDDEALHDFRIAIRRTRSLISQSKALFGKARARAFLADFKWIGDFTTPVRDLDVLALKLEDYGAAVPRDYQANLVIIRQFLDQQRTMAYRELQDDLVSHRYIRLIEDWKGFLEKRLNNSDASQNEPSILQHANVKTWLTYLQVLKEGRAIGPDSPATALHELRKTCKKLRYLIDFFADLHDAESVAKMIRILKKIQNYLGDFQDCEAHLALLQRYQKQTRLPANVQISFMLINEFLITELHQRESAMRGDFDSRFAAFDRPRTHQLMTTMYQPN